MNVLAFHFEHEGHVLGRGMTSLLFKVMHIEPWVNVKALEKDCLFVYDSCFLVASLSLRLMLSWTLYAVRTEGVEFIT